MFNHGVSSFLIDTAGGTRRVLRPIWLSLARLMCYFVDISPGGPALTDVGRTFRRLGLIPHLHISAQVMLSPCKSLESYKEGVAEPDQKQERYDEQRNIFGQVGIDTKLNRGNQYRELLNEQVSGDQATYQTADDLAEHDHGSGNFGFVMAVAADEELTELGLMFVHNNGLKDALFTFSAAVLVHFSEPEGRRVFIF